MYQYTGEIISTTDGDTIHLTMDLGMRMYYKTSCRLAGINAPELKSTDEAIRAKAIAAKEYLATLLPAGTKVILDSKSLDKYGRAIVVITLNGLNINDKMIESGNAIIYK